MESDGRSKRRGYRPTTGGRPTDRTKLLKKALRSFDAWMDEKEKCARLRRALEDIARLTAKDSHDRLTLLVHLKNIRRVAQEALKEGGISGTMKLKDACTRHAGRGNQAMAAISFYAESVHDQMSPAIKGKTIESVRVEEGYQDFFVIRFTDSTELRILYDYIYEWELRP